jgi:hypothetical protein
MLQFFNVFARHSCIIANSKATESVTPRTVNLNPAADMEPKLTREYRMKGCTNGERNFLDT